MTIERLTTGDFIGRLLVRSGVRQGLVWLCRGGQVRAGASFSADRGQVVGISRAHRPADVWLACGLFEG